MRNIQYLALLILFSLVVCFGLNQKILNKQKLISSLGSNVITGYWGCNPGSFRSTMTQLKTGISLGYNVIIFAFYDVYANGTILEDPGSVATPVKSDIANSNFIYLASLFGGENGYAPTVNNPTSWANAMYQSFVGLRNRFGFDGIDIDLENAWGSTPDNVVCGLRSFFKLMHQNGYIVSMAPQTTAITPQVSIYSPGSWNSYAPLADTSIIESVDFLAVQLYNNAVPFNNIEQYGLSLNSGFNVSSCPCGASCQVKVQNQKKITFGYPAGPGAAPSGCPGLPGGCPYGSALTNIYNSSPFLKTTGGVMTWSLEWDESFSWSFVKAAKAINFN